jgi:thiosulfate/3-mercaptopyruvate sulfurtransferase
MRDPIRPVARLAVLLAVALGPPAPAAGAPEASPAPPAVLAGEWLQANLDAKDVVLLDARPLRDFLAGHLPGARSLAVENLRSTAGGVPAVTYPPEVLGTIFARAGVSRASHVVVYGAESDIDATYVATAARIAGASRVSVLDGGFARWTADGRPVTKDRLLSAAARPDLAGDGTLLATIEDVRQRLGDGKTVFLDVRPEEQWAAGRLPGAKNRFWKKDVDGGLFRPEAATRAEMEAVGVSWEKPVVVYCNSGHQASEGFYTLRYRLGHPDVRLYQGSWLEWSMTPGTPREASTPAETK